MSTCHEITTVAVKGSSCVEMQACIKCTWTCTCTTAVWFGETVQGRQSAEPCRKESHVRWLTFFHGLMSPLFREYKLLKHQALFEYHPLVSFKSEIQKCSTVLMHCVNIYVNITHWTTHRPEHWHVLRPHINYGLETLRQTLSDSASNSLTEECLTLLLKKCVAYAYILTVM